MFLLVKYKVWLFIHLITMSYQLVVSLGSLVRHSYFSTLKKPRSVLVFLMFKSKLLQLHSVWKSSCSFYLAEKVSNVFEPTKCKKRCIKLFEFSLQQGPFGHCADLSFSYKSTLLFNASMDTRRFKVPYSDQHIRHGKRALADFNRE